MENVFQTLDAMLDAMYRRWHHVTPVKNTNLELNFRVARRAYGVRLHITIIMLPNHRTVFDLILRITRQDQLGVARNIENAADLLITTKLGFNPVIVIN